MRKDTEEEETMKRHEEIVFTRDIADMEALQDFSGHHFTIKDLLPESSEGAAPQTSQKDRICNLSHFLHIDRSRHAKATLPQEEGSRRFLLRKLLGRRRPRRVQEIITTRQSWR